MCSEPTLSGPTADAHRYDDVNEQTGRVDRLGRLRAVLRLGERENAGQEGRAVLAAGGEEGARGRCWSWAAAPAGSRCRSPAPASRWSASIDPSACSSGRRGGWRRCAGGNRLGAGARSSLSAATSGRCRSRMRTFNDGACPVRHPPVAAAGSRPQPTLASVARVLRPGGLLGLDLVPDVPNWREYTNRIQLRGNTTRRDASHPHRIRSPERQAAPDHLRADLPGTPWRRRTEHRFDLTFRTLPVPPDDPPPRTRRVQDRGDPRRLPGRSVGRASRRVDHAGATA